MKRYYLITAVFILLNIVCCSGGEPKLALDCEIPNETTTFSFDQESYPSESGLFDKYTISPGDILDILFQITTWKKQTNFTIKISHTLSIKFMSVPELNTEQRVLPNGKIVLPHLGEVDVVGFTIDKLANKLEKKYAKILRNPDIFISPTLR